MADAATTFDFKDVLVFLVEAFCALVTRPAGLPASLAARLGGMLQFHYVLPVSCKKSYRGGSLQGKRELCFWERSGAGTTHQLRHAE
jgi:hypothetical protein